MRITALVENTTKTDLKAVHGLSLYIETAKHKILFDLGPDGTLFENAKKKGVDLEAVDTVIISHGHNDHGGALKAFLEVNRTAKVYVQASAFEPHFSKVLFVKVPVGLDASLKDNGQIVLLDGDFAIDDELFLFTVNDSGFLRSPMNNVLYGRDGIDTFAHEQNLIIKGEQNVLVMGCGHAGVANIMEKAAQYGPRLCVGGFHLFNPISKKHVKDSLLDSIANVLDGYGDTEFYTCHCTGSYSYEYLAGKLGNMHYLSCGEEISL